MIKQLLPCLGKYKKDAILAPIFITLEVILDILIPLLMADLIDFEKEKARLASEIAKLEGEVKRLEGKLGNAGFVAKAPAAVVEAERAKLTAAQEKLAATKAALAKLS